MTIAAIVVLMGSGGLWWQRQVTGDPHLEFSGPNVYRDEAATDHTGIVIDRRDFDEAERVQVAFVPGGRLHVFVDLHNGGGHDVRIEAAPTAGMYYWAFDGMSVASDPYAGFATRYRPFQPFTLHRGETRDVRLDFRQADCDASAFEPGGFSTVRALPLRYHILGISRRADVPFQDSAIALRAPETCTHPMPGNGSS